MDTVGGKSSLDKEVFAYRMATYNLGIPFNYMLKPAFNNIQGSGNEASFD